MNAIDVTYFCDPGSPWGFAASPQLALLRYRYGEQLRFRLVVIGLWEIGGDREAIGYDPVGTAKGGRLFRRFGMPFSTAPRPRVLGSGRPCRAVVAARLTQPEREHDVLRALQFAFFTTDLMVDTDDGIGAALAAVPGLDVEAILGALDGPEVAEAYAADHAEARTAAGSPSEFIGSAVPDTTGEAIRYTPPTLIFEQGEDRIEVGGYQPLESYEVAIAHIDRTLERRWNASDPVDALERVGYPMTTFEIATCTAEPRLPPDPDPVEDALVALAAEGRVTRTECGADVLWGLAGSEIRRRPRLSGNVELQRRALDAFHARDVEAFVACLHPSVEYHSAMTVPGGAVYHGHDGVRKYFEDFRDAWGDEFRVEPEAFFDLGEQTLLFYRVHGLGQRSGADVAMPGAQVCRWRDGLMVYGRAYADREDALRDLGVSADALEPVEL